MDSGVARAPIVDMDAYQDGLKARLDPTASSLQIIMNKSRQNAKRMIFAEGEQEQVIRAAVAYKDLGLGEPISLARKILCGKIWRHWVLTGATILKFATRAHPTASTIYGFSVSKIAAPRPPA